MPTPSVTAFPTLIRRYATSVPIAIAVFVALRMLEVASGTQPAPSTPVVPTDFRAPIIYASEQVAISLDAFIATLLLGWGISALLTSNVFSQATSLLNLGYKIISKAWRALGPGR